MFLFVGIMMSRPSYTLLKAVGFRKVTIMDTQIVGESRGVNTLYQMKSSKFRDTYI